MHLKVNKFNRVIKLTFGKLFILNIMTLYKSPISRSQDLKGTKGSGTKGSSHLTSNTFN